MVSRPSIGGDAGLLHASHRLPSLDYRDLLAATLALTKSQAQVLEAFRRAAFNVLACNRDDHVRNFAFLMDARGEWTLSPAFDLTLSEGMRGHHTTSLLGETLRPTRQGLLSLASGAALPAARAEKVLREVERGVDRFGKLALAGGVSQTTLKRAQRRLVEVRGEYDGHGA